MKGGKKNEMNESIFYFEIDGVAIIRRTRIASTALPNRLLS